MGSGKRRGEGGMERWVGALLCMANAALFSIHAHTHMCIIYMHFW